MATVARSLAARSSSPARSRRRSSGEYLDNAYRSATSLRRSICAGSKGGFADRSVRSRLVVVSLWLGMFPKQISGTFWLELPVSQSFSPPLALALRVADMVHVWGERSRLVCKLGRSLSFRRTLLGLIGLGWGCCPESERAEECLGPLRGGGGVWSYCKLSQ